MARQGDRANALLIQARPREATGADVGLLWGLFTFVWLATGPEAEEVGRAPDEP